MMRSPSVELPRRVNESTDRFRRLSLNIARGTSQVWTFSRGLIRSLNITSLSDNIAQGFLFSLFNVIGSLLGDTDRARSAHLYNNAAALCNYIIIIL
jgi:hypothetical protein